MIIYVTFVLQHTWFIIYRDDSALYRIKVWIVSSMFNHPVYYGTHSFMISPFHIFPILYIMEISHSYKACESKIVFSILKLGTKIYKYHYP